MAQALKPSCSATAGCLEIEKADREAIATAEHRAQKIDAFVELHATEAVHVLHDENSSAGVALLQELVQAASQAP